MRVVHLIPWLRCFETVLRKFPEAKNDPSFVMFFRSISARHDGTPSPDAEVVDWPAYNFTVGRIVAHLQQPKLAYSEEELHAIGRLFPDYWIYLAEGGLFEKQPSEAAARSLELKQRKVEIEGQAPRQPPGTTPLDVDRTEKVPPAPLPLTVGQKAYCKKYLSYRQLVYNAEDLGEYQRVLENRTYEDVANTNEKEMRERVARRFEALKQEVAAERAGLARELLAIQGKSRWFRNGHCLQ